MEFWKEARSGEMNKILRIISGNCMQICEMAELYSDSDKAGLYCNISVMNHSCVPNTVNSWVMGDFQRSRVRAILTIEKDEEILRSYQDTTDFDCGSREFRRQTLLEMRGFLCQCSHCSLEGEDLEENERMREEIREKGDEIGQLLGCEGSAAVSRKDVKKAMKSAQRIVKLIQELNIRAGYVAAMIKFYQLAVLARIMNISCVNDPDIYKREALKYAKMFGDNYLYLYNKKLGN